jgi:hypothetical protein
MLPPNVPGSDPEVRPVRSAQQAGNVAKAKAALKACGKPNGFKTTIAVRNNKPAEVATAESLQASLKKVGINAEIDQYEGSQTAGIIGSPENVKKKGYGIIIMGWGPTSRPARASAAAVGQQVHPAERQLQLRRDQRQDDRRPVRPGPRSSTTRRRRQIYHGDQPQGHGGRVLPALRLREGASTGATRG